MQKNIRKTTVPFPARDYDFASPQNIVRPLDAVEHNMERLNRIANGAGVVYQMAKIRGTLTAEAVRDALAQLQRRNPMMRVRIALSETKEQLVWETSDNPIALTVLEVDNLDEWESLMEADMNAGPTASWDGPAFRAALLHSAGAPDQSVLLLIGDHCACDAISCSAMVAELLELVAGQASAVEREFPTLVSPYTATMTEPGFAEWFAEQSQQVAVWGELSDDDGEKQTGQQALLAELGG